MASERTRPRAPPFIDPPGYARHRPEATLLYQIVARHYPEFVAAREAAGRPLPKYVKEEFEAYLKCGSKFLFAADVSDLLVADLQLRDPLESSHGFFRMRRRANRVFRTPE